MQEPEEHVPELEKIILLLPLHVFAGGKVHCEFEVHWTHEPPEQKGVEPEHVVDAVEYVHVPDEHSGEYVTAVLPLHAGGGAVHCEFEVHSGTDWTLKLISLDFPMPLFPTSTYSAQLPTVDEENVFEATQLPLLSVLDE